MKKSIVIGLGVAAVAVGGIAWLADRNARREAAAEQAMPAYLFPDLAARAGDVAGIEVRKGGTTIALQRREGKSSGDSDAWTLAQRAGYPAQIDTVRSVIVGLANLKPIEEKTRKKENYAKIGVEDPVEKAPEAKPADAAPKPEEAAGASSGSGGTLVTLKDSRGQTLASAIIGKPNQGNEPQVYVRRAGEEQSWLAKGRVEAPADALAWLDRQVINVARERVDRASVLHPDGAQAAVSREKPETAFFAVENVPAGRELTAPSVGDALGGALTFLQMDDVKPAREIDFATNPGAAAEFRTFDGLVVKVSTVQVDGKTWATFWAGFDESSRKMPEEPKADPAKPDQPPPPVSPQAKALKTVDEVKREAEEINARVGGWAYLMPDYKVTALTPKMDGWLKPLAPPAPPQGANQPAGLPPAANPVPGQPVEVPSPGVPEPAPAPTNPPPGE